MQRIGEDRRHPPPER